MWWEAEERNESSKRQRETSRTVDRAAEAAAVEAVSEAAETEAHNGAAAVAVPGEGVLEGGKLPHLRQTPEIPCASKQLATNRPAATATAMHSTATATSTVTEQTPALILFPDKTRLDPATAPAAAPQATATRATTTATQTTAVATTATTDTATTLATSSAAIDTAITAGEAEADPT